MAKAVSAAELAKEVLADPSAFRHYLLRHWGGRQRYQRWLFTRAQADRIRAAYRAHGKGKNKRLLPRNKSLVIKQLKLLNE